MKMLHILGKIASRYGIKKECVALYEKVYSTVRTVQMYALYPLDYCYKKKHTIQIMSLSDTIQYIFDHHCSVTRYGDGELNAISNHSLGFQSYHPELSAKLRKYVKPEMTDSDCLICLPGILAYEKDYEATVKKFWLKILVHDRKRWYHYLDTAYAYGNADITRCYIELKDRSKSRAYFQQLMKIWAERDIVIVEGEKSRLGIGTDLLSDCRSIRRILCPAMNAFSFYEEIFEYVKSNISKDSLILLALGPTATVMAVELSECGYQAIDIGNVDKEYEWCLAKSEQKTVNPLKFTMEVKNGTNVEICRDPDYIKQIMHVISDGEEQVENVKG